MDPSEEENEGSEMNEPKKKPYTKPEVKGIFLEDDEALLKLFRRNRKYVQELRRIVNGLLKKSRESNIDRSVFAR